jgi:FKBP-type peptidyl-prolyl cis-trans isomerase FkpA
MRKVIFVILLCCGFLLLDGCKNNDPTCTTSVPESKLTGISQDQLAIDIGKIDAFLASNNITNVLIEPNGTRYVINTLGTSDKIPCLESRVRIAYTGWNIQSTKSNAFDSNSDATFTLSGLILGWQLVLPLVPGGSKVTLYIPSVYAYGSSVAAGGKIPANANLVFEIELL